MTIRAFIKSTVLTTCLLFSYHALGLEPEKTALKYNYYFQFKGDAKGRILIFFPYRIYYEASASVDLIAEKRKDSNTYDFFCDVVKFAFVARTLDFGGKKMCLMNADYDYQNNLKFAQEKLNYLKTIPYYSQYMKSCGIFPYEITARDKNAVKFIRDPGGVVKDVFVDFKLLRKFDDKKFVTYFHIDKLMVEMLKCYSHSYFPRRFAEELSDYMTKEWLSAQLDYSATMNEVSRLISTFTEKYVLFQQEEPLRLKYKVVYSNPWTIHLIGESYANVKIWSDWKLKKVIRSVKFNIKDYVVLEDEMTADIRNKKENGGTLYMILKKID
jgi:hypothetical protein